MKLFEDTTLIYFLGDRLNLEVSLYRFKNFLPYSINADEMLCFDLFLPELVSNCELIVPNGFITYFKKNEATGLYKRFNYLLGIYKEIGFVLKPMDKLLPIWIEAGKQIEMPKFDVVLFSGYYAKYYFMNLSSNNYNVINPEEPNSDELIYKEIPFRY